MPSSVASSQGTWRCHLHKDPGKRRGEQGDLWKSQFSSLAHFFWKGKMMVERKETKCQWGKMESTQSQSQSSPYINITVSFANGVLLSNSIHQWRWSFSTRFPPYPLRPTAEHWDLYLRSSVKDMMCGCISVYANIYIYTCTYLESKREMYGYLLWFEYFLRYSDW